MMPQRQWRRSRRSDGGGGGGGGGGGISGRYFRLQCDDGRTGNYCMAEMRVLDGTDTNIALGATVTSDATSISASYGPDKLVDGGLVIATNHWTTNNSTTDPWIHIDLGSVQDIVKYQLVSPDPGWFGPSSMPTSWYVEVSDNDIDWTLVDTITIGSAWLSSEEREYTL